MFYSRLQVICDSDFREILMAEVADAGFDTFLETDLGFEAYVEGDEFQKEKLEALREKYKNVEPLSLLVDRVEKQNWNEEWEKNYEPIIVENKCLIRAAFHPGNSDFPYDIVITPKMSFGTGHHQTTYLMISAQLNIDHARKRVMDAGCGTAILSIMASKLGAKDVVAFDIDEWSMLNGKENAEVNKCTNINLQQGKIEELHIEGEFDIILANINKNVLLAEMKTYQRYMTSKGYLLLSGFYVADVEDLKTEAEKYKLVEVRRDEREGWASLLLRKS